MLIFDVVGVIVYMIVASLFYSMVFLEIGFFVKVVFWLWIFLVVVIKYSEYIYGFIGILENININRAISFF